MVESELQSDRQCEWASRQRQDCTTQGIEPAINGMMMSLPCSINMVPNMRSDDMSRERHVEVQIRRLKGDQYLKIVKRLMKISYRRVLSVPPEERLIDLAHI